LKEGFYNENSKRNDTQLRTHSTGRDISENGNNNVVAKYEGKKYTAVNNPFSGLYYVDDVYGAIAE
jgi:hypothetical protein